MTDTTNTNVIVNGGRNYVVQFTMESDGSDSESTPVKKIDISTLTGTKGAAPATIMVDEIAYSVQGYNFVTVEFDADVSDEIAVLSGDGVKVFPGGLKDPQSTGYSGDIFIGTNGGASGSSYDITLACRLKN